MSWFGVVARHVTRRLVRNYRAAIQMGLICYTITPILLYMKKQFNVRLEEGAIQAIKIACRKSGKTESQMIEEWAYAHGEKPNMNIISDEYNQVVSEHTISGRPIASIQSPFKPTVLDPLSKRSIFDKLKEQMQ